MKFKIVFYLFIFVCILLFFQLFNTNKVLNYQDDLIQKQNLTYIKLKDSIKGLNEYKSTNNYFSLTADSNLMKGESNIDLVRLENQLIDVLRGLNSKQGLRKLLTKIPKEGTYLVETSARQVFLAVFTCFMYIKLFSCFFMFLFCLFVFVF